MAIFKSKDVIPSIYSSESRDFQLFTNILDFVQNSIKFDVDTMIHTVSTEDTSNNYLERLKSKVGFYTTNDYDDNTMRLALSSFPYCVKYKGSFEGIRRCVNVYLKHLGVRGMSKVDVYNNDTEYSFTIRIGIPGDKSDTTLLTDMLSYVVPAGYFLDVYFYNESAFDPTHSYLHTKHQLLFPEEIQNTTVRPHELHSGEHESSDEIEILEDKTFSTVQLGMVFEPEENQDKEETSNEQ